MVMLVMVLNNTFWYSRAIRQWYRLEQGTQSGCTARLDSFFSHSRLARHSSNNSTLVHSLLAGALASERETILLVGVIIFVLPFAIEVG